MRALSGTQMSLRSAASSGAMQTVAGMVLSFLSIKITSVYLGPAGIATVGQLNYVIALTMGLLGAGLHTGLVRRFAELGGDPTQRERVVSTVLKSLLIIGLPIAIFMCLGSGWLSRVLLFRADLGFSILIFAGVVAFGLVAMVITACANGAKDFKTLALINIGSGAASLALFAALCPRFGLAGGLIATAALPLATFTIAWALARRHAWWPRRVLSAGFSTSEIRGMATFVPMAVVTTVSLPLLQLLIRDIVVTHSGVAAVGLLQGVMRISEMYLGIVGSVFAMYFFPRFSEIKDANELQHEVKRGLLVVVPSVAVVSFAIYVLRDWIVRFVFTSDFLPMRDLFAWQMAGNTLKMVGSLFGYLLLAKSNALVIAVLELVSIGTWWILSIYFISANGVVGATQAYATAFALYSIVTLIFASLLLRRMRAQARLGSNDSST